MNPTVAKENWPLVQLGDLCDISIGRTPARNRRDYWGPGSPWLSISDMKQGRDLHATVETITDVAARECNCRLVPAGTVLLSFKLSIGKVGITRRSLFTNEAIAALPINDASKLRLDFLYWSLRSIDLTRGLDRAAKGLTLNSEKLRRILISLPPLAEQRRIAEILDKVDALRAKRRAALAQLDTLTQSNFLDMFGDPATNPRGWHTDVLGVLISVGPQNGLYKPASDYGSGTPILRIDAFYDGVVTGLSNLKRVRVSDTEKAAYGLRQGEIVINRVNSREYLGKSALVPRLPESIVFESNMMRLGVDPARIDPVFLIQLLQTRHVRAHILRSSKDAVNQSSINQQDVKSIPLILPPLPQQKQFASHVRASELLVERQRDSLATFDELFASLQHRAFRGEL